MSSFPRLAAALAPAVLLTATAAFLTAGPAHAAPVPAGVSTSVTSECRAAFASTKESYKTRYEQKKVEIANVYEAKRDIAKEEREQTGDRGAYTNAINSAKLVKKTATAANKAQYAADLASWDELIRQCKTNPDILHGVG